MEATICYLQAGGPGKLMVWLSLNPKAWEPGAPMSKGRRIWMSQLKQKGQIHLSSTFLFYLGLQEIG